MAQTNPWDCPNVEHEIMDDVPVIHEILLSLAKMSPDQLGQALTGFKRMAQISDSQAQLQTYNEVDATWSAVPTLVHNITGTSSAITGVNPVANGGTGAATIEDARANLDVPSNNELTTASETLNQSIQSVQDGVIALENTVAGLPTTEITDTLSEKITTVEQTAATHVLADMTNAAAATKTTKGAVSVGAGLTVNTFGELSVKLSDAIDSESSFEVATSKAVKIAYDKAVAAENAGGHPLGFEFASLYVPEGCLLCNGALYDKATYADLFALKQKEGRVVTEAKWQEIAAASGGYCAMYADNGGNFRVPKPAPYLKMALDAAAAGQYEEAGLPNIKGNTWFRDSSQGYGIFMGGNGPFALSDEKQGNVTSLQLATGNSKAAIGFDFNASRYDPTYGNSTTVTPESHSYLWVVQAFGVATNVGAADVSDALAKFGAIQAELETKVDAAGAAHAAVFFDKPVEVPVLASGSHYIAPEDGYFVFRLKNNDTSSVFTDLSIESGYLSYYNRLTQNELFKDFIPVAKGTGITITQFSLELYLWFCPLKESN